MFVCRLTWDVVLQKTEKGLTGFCLTTNPVRQAQLMVYTEMGPWEGAGGTASGAMPTLLFFPVRRKRR
jgi:hypothetical protein